MDYNKPMPLLITRGIVIFPCMIVNFDVGREKSIKALENAMADNQYICLVAQKNTADDDPGPEAVTGVGTVACIKQIMKLPGKTARVLVEGIERVIIEKIRLEDGSYNADIVPFETEKISPAEEKAYLRELRDAFEEYFSNNPKINAESFMTMMEIDDPLMLADVICANISFETEVKRKILEAPTAAQRIQYLCTGIRSEIEIMTLEKNLSEKVKANIDRHQKEYYLREQARVIREELGEDENPASEAEEYKAKTDSLKMPAEAKEKIGREIRRLTKMPPMSSEAAVIRSYLDYIIELPWNKKTRERFDIRKAEEILNRDHYGLEKVKERVLEHLAVRKLAKGGACPILCFVGPPGVGKTSVAKSIASALGRKYVRISLGGIHDEADIRGHRKTYIGSMPGRIIAAVKQAESKNPLILLDEIDKVGRDMRGDPQAALLEVLDSEQNHAFRDHYLEVDFDLSEVMFITTANTLETVSRPLLDRMEVIEVGGYTDEEKMNIAVKYLMPREIEKNGLKDKKVEITDGAVMDIINYYTREAGVRNLEKQIGAVCRKAAKSILYNKRKSITVTEKNLDKYLGRRKYSFDMMNDNDETGVARGLAWTSVGGDTLSIEVNIMPGSGNIELTGMLGDVMKESALAAVSYIRSRADEFELPEDFHKSRDVHIHVPEGATPKDGPSAGITMATAVVSALTKRPVRKDVAMTGEITTRGRVLPIGGLKEKSLAAYRAGIRTIIIPEKNKKDLEDIPEKIRREIKFVAVSDMDAVLKTALAGRGKKVKGRGNNESS
ncbi:MAG: endopeptidase La [Oscillospiraceae bacterium]|nr:endopeptidase La [Oscillospiraceae bacterium]